MRVRELADVVEEIAPSWLAEEWDNVGLQVGDPQADTGPILTALEVTPAVIDEARQLGAGVIVSHHPLIFKPLKSVVASTPVERMVTCLIRHGIALIVAHTNLDSIADGTNGELADRLGLKQREFLDPVWEEEHDKPRYGLGLVGSLDEPETLGDFTRRCRAAFGVPAPGVVGDSEKPIQRVAVCSGAGGEALRAWTDGLADVLVTGEMNHHQCAEARDRGISSVLLGHFESEVIVGPRLARLIAETARKRGHETVLHTSHAEKPPLTRR